MQVPIRITSANAGKHYSGRHVAARVLKLSNCFWARVPTATRSGKLARPCFPIDETGLGGFGSLALQRNLASEAMVKHPQDKVGHFPYVPPCTIMAVRIQLHSQHQTFVLFMSRAFQTCRATFRIGAGSLGSVQQTLNPKL